MLNIIRFLRGFVRIRVTGFAPERFLNLCSVHDIELWAVCAVCSVCILFRSFYGTLSSQAETD